MVRKIVDDYKAEQAKKAKEKKDEEKDKPLKEAA